MKLTFLGTGTSQGIPVIACECDVCKSTDSKDKRLRTSVLIESDSTSVAIDSGPDFRQQMLNCNQKKLDAIVFTHEHKDHVAGLDDVRAFNFKSKKDMEVYASQNVIDALKREFHYVFNEFKYPGVPSLNINLINKDSVFTIGDIQFSTIQVFHYKLPVYSYRINDLVYVTDANKINDEEADKMIGCKTLIINALRKEEHISHFNLKQAIEFSDKVGAQKVYLIHLSHLMGKHEELELPKHVEIAYDGLQITF
jgi:phosphoribosyl 1,2-cyclic phosphate phosphodiesterase